MKIFSSDSDFQRKLENSIKLVSDYVLKTYGPYGKNILINEKGKSFLTKDGVTVAKSVNSKDLVENSILDIIKQVAEKTVNDAGDGPQPLYSKVLTPDGFVEMGSLKIGDKICGTNNSIQEVIDIFPKGLKRIYKMKFSNNRTVECCLDHLWNVYTSHGVEKTITVKQLLESKIKKQQADGSFLHKYYTPITSVEFFSKDTELDPFLMGLLIGDGSLCSSGSIELSLGLNQEYVLEKLVLPENIKYIYTKDLKKNYLRIKFSRKEKNGPTMHEYIRRAGLLNKKSKDKFIPKEYLYSSHESRMRLLEGLIESDGYINARDRIEYSTVSSQLCSDFVELMRGLGKQVNVTLKKRNGNSFSNNSIYAITELKGDKYGIKLKEIEETNEYTEMMCIKVSNPDNLYITDDYIVTHNTTTSILFLREFIKSINSAIKAFPHSTPTEIKEKFDECLQFVFKELEKNAEDVSSVKTLSDIAFMASNGDKTVASLISNLIDKVGVSGSVSIKNSKTGKTYIEIVEGMKFKSAIASSVFLNDLQDKKTLSDCVVVISNVNIEFSEDLLYLLSDCVANKKSVLFVCPNMDEKSITTIIANVQRGALNCAVISPAYLGGEKLEVFDDIALICGTTVNTTKFINRTKVSQWGYCKNVELTRTTCTLTEANASAELLDKTIESLRSRLASEEDENAQKRIDARIGRLTSTLGVIYVGGQTEAEIIEKRHRVEDALESCHSAMRKGIVPGGGTSFYKIFVHDENQKHFEKDLLSSYIFDAVSWVCLSVPELLYGMKKYISFREDRIEKVLDLRTNKMVNPFENGIIESVWTIQSALRNSFSAAWVLCQAYGAIIDNKEYSGE
jgi:chaperonin GroEL